MTITRWLGIAAAVAVLGCSTDDGTGTTGSADGTAVVGETTGGAGDDSTGATTGGATGDATGAGDTGGAMDGGQTTGTADTGGAMDGGATTGGATTGGQTGPTTDSGGGTTDGGPTGSTTGDGGPCVTNDECDGDPGGSVCDWQNGICVECLGQADCVDSPGGSQCSQWNTCEHANGCTHQGECIGNPAGEFCVFFEERCGQCLVGSDCGGGEFCSLDFECVPYTDAFCADADDDKPKAVGTECVECVADGDCGGSYQVHCGPGNQCVECTSDGHCTDADEPVCSGSNNCGECKTDSDCGGDTPQCSEYGQCKACDSAECPDSLPYCGSEDTCQECLYDTHCDTDNSQYCFEGQCQFEAVSCGNDNACKDHSKLTHCHDQLVKCVECTSDWHCSWGLFGWGADACDTGSGQCVECQSDSDCIYQVCDGGTQQCVDCNGDSDCEKGEFCTESHNCSDGCQDDSNCPADAPLCSEYNECVECTQESDCAGNPDGDICVYGECNICEGDFHCEGSVNGPYCNFGKCSETDLGSCSGWAQCNLDTVEYVCGKYVNGCDNTFECGLCGKTGTCSDGGRDCTCPIDPVEEQAANNTSGSASDLGDFSDSPNEDFGVQNLSIHSDDDVDWYTFHVDDDGFDGNPDVTVSLTVQSPGFAQDDSSNYELTLWVACDDFEDDVSTCLEGDGAAEPAFGTGCRSEGWDPHTVSARIGCDWALNDSGTARVRVEKTHRYGRCDNYTLAVKIE